MLACGPKHAQRTMRMVAGWRPARIQSVPQLLHGQCLCCLLPATRSSIRADPEVCTRARVCMQGTLQMFRNDGIRGMFKGNGLNCIRIIPNQGETVVAR